MSYVCRREVSCGQWHADNPKKYYFDCINSQNIQVEARDVYIPRLVSI